MVYHTDGYTIKSNPSKIGGGFTICNGIDGELIKTKEIRKKNFTNNEAELLGVLESARLLPQNSEIITDSMNTIYWVRRGKSKARPDLDKLCDEAKELIKQKNLKITWKPREENWAGVYNEERNGR